MTSSNYESDNTVTEPQQYIIVGKLSVGELEFAVNAKIKEGYEPIGAMVVGGNGYFYQTMIGYSNFQFGENID